ncbi:3-hydroxyacyl-CoA dehydrogenase NAD-binding domain-containing protein [Caulobacter endophyticus]|uniref:3-hydroxyacyl-CoA dehydrogenase NAD-binding domain-containing protein n=1 Tax=Caulobacter endophyticus TaxID=2172652 RepID=UPI0024104799|nr:3-hydroxyacyl-CoA dehydrogenase NAD-binding domain-containing protein [Caulobacter endophyticus]MDG2529041.1 3-hydroxyacyl-CoA dehydrogenase NAD-binding domain-containing protein [Caulobacter endophyticus]
MQDRVLTLLEPRDFDLGPRPVGEAPYRHWTLTRDIDNVAWAVLDKAGAGANTLDDAVLVELDQILDRLEADRPAGLVIRSAKASGFIAGADVGQFRGASDVSEVEQRMARAHAITDRLEAVTFPTVAVAHGYALGGGLEVALACHNRIAVEGAKFGFPEVQLGLHPGLGGTARFTRLIDPLQAMQFMLTGKTIPARKARSLGLVDAVVPERHVRAAVRAAVKGELKHEQPGILDRLKDSGPARRIAARRMREEAARQAPGEHYPAPGALIDLWERHGGDFEAMKAAEIGSFARLMVSETAQNLIRVFFLREKLKGLAGGKSAIRRVHVIGAGAMGGDIAAWCAWSGLTVTLTDVKAEPIGGAIKRAAALYGKIGRDDRLKVRDALDRLIPDLKGQGARLADLVIEAAPEKVDLKKGLYAKLEPAMKTAAILATNTSSIPLETLREGLQRPERLVGLHFFNPVSRMQLVEVVRHDGLDPEVETAARAFAGAIDRLPAPARSAPGFIVNRALTPYLAEALVMLDEGVVKETIDKAAEDFGMPMGPIELADQVGLDICLAVADMLKRELGWAVPDAPQWLRDKVEQKKLGKKTGEGLYVWKEDGPVKAHDAPKPEPDMADRLILPLVNTAAALLGEGVSDDPDVIDAAMIFGAGFAPFRGGPLHYARRRGVGEVKARLEELAGKYGERFKPAAGWSKLEG